MSRHIIVEAIGKSRFFPVFKLLMAPTHDGRGLKLSRVINIIRVIKTKWKGKFKRAAGATG
jgi:hypothetical protein